MRALEVEPGTELGPLRKTITQEKIARYAAASGDHNPLHLDQDFAAATQFGGTIAHGMLLLAYLSEMLTAAFGGRWLEGGRLQVRFRGPARPGDTIMVTGLVKAVDASTGVTASIECRNQAGEILVSGETVVTNSRGLP